MEAKWMFVFFSVAVAAIAAGACFNAWLDARDTTACVGGAWEMDRAAAPPECRNARVELVQVAGKVVRVCTCSKPAKTTGTEAP
jgi:hypothetical protein